MASKGIVLAFFVLTTTLLNGCRPATVSVTVSNNSEGDYCELFIWPTEDRWGNFMLNRFYQPLASGEVFTVPDLRPGFYNIQAIPCDSSSQTFTWNEIDVGVAIELEFIDQQAP